MNDVAIITSRLASTSLRSFITPCLRQQIRGIATQRRNVTPQTWACNGTSCVGSQLPINSFARSSSTSDHAFCRPPQRSFATSVQLLAKKHTKRSSSRSTASRKLTWRDYDPEGGLPLPGGDLLESDIHATFGLDMTTEAGNWILRLMNYRRQSGSLIDLGIVFPEDSGVTQDMAFKALTYLRQTQPFDEQAAGTAWADEQIASLQEDLQERAVRVGLYKKTSDEESQSSDDLYGQSVLVETRKANEARWKEEESRKAEELKAQELAQVNANVADPSNGQQATATNEQTLTSNNDSREVAVTEAAKTAWLQPVERKPWVKYYEEQATIIKENIVPQMSIAQRLGPSALVALTVLALCVYLHETYTPPPRSARLFPDIPPAIATIGAIAAINIAIAIAWRLPPLWRTMNQWFVSVPARPVPTGVITSMFAHQAFSHLFFNMVLLWAFGSILHEDVGRGSFLAIYLGTGVSAGFFSLAVYALRRQWMAYVFGSSTAVYGIIAATCLLRANSDFHLYGIDVPMTGMVVLGGLVGLELLSLRFGRLSSTVDYVGHFGGLGAGAIAAFLIRRENRGQQMKRVDAVDDADASTEAGDI